MSNTDNPAESPGGDNVTPSAPQSLPAKLRVHALAKLLATSSRAVLTAITELGGSARTVQSSVDRELAQRVADHLGNPVVETPAAAGESDSAGQAAAEVSSTGQATAGQVPAGQGSAEVSSAEQASAVPSAGSSGTVGGDGGAAATAPAGSRNGTESTAHNESTARAERSGAESGAHGEGSDREQNSAHGESGAHSADAGTADQQGAGVARSAGAPLGASAPHSESAAHESEIAAHTWESTALSAGGAGAAPAGRVADAATGDVDQPGRVATAGAEAGAFVEHGASAGNAESDRTEAGQGAAIATGDSAGANPDEPESTAEGAAVALTQGKQVVKHQPGFTYSGGATPESTGTQSTGTQSAGTQPTDAQPAAGQQPGAPLFAAASPLFLQPEPQPSQPGSKPESQPESKPKSESKPDPVPESKTESKTPSESAEPDGAEDAEDGDQDEFDGEDGGRKRRRRGRRGRGRGKGAEADWNDAAEDDQDEAAQPEQGKQAGKSTQNKKDEQGKKSEQDKPDDQAKKSEKSGSGKKSDKQSDGRAADDTSGDDEDADGESNASRRRRRRRRRKGGDENGNNAGDPPNTVTHLRETQSGGGDEVRAVRGSTRLEAKRQRRRDGREAGRRRTPILSEAEFLARRESVQRRMVVREDGEHTQIGVLEDGVLVEHFVTTHGAGSLVGNVYLGRVQNVLPSMEAAFVDIGRGRNAVLYAGEVDWDAAGLEGKSRRIEQALNTGDSVLVQVTKDPVGHKGARLTTQVSLPGRYLVYVPGGSATGISRKLPDNERKRLKEILKRIVPEEAGVIIRTASEGIAEEDLGRDVSRLQAQWEAIKERSSAKSTKAPELVYEEPDLLVKVVRDLFTEDFTELVVSGDTAWRTINGYVEQVAPDMGERVRKHTADSDVFGEYRIDEQIAKALDRKVWLPSGGYLVIDRTEAMTVIDVNTGKFTGSGGNLEETVTRNNLESAEEIVRQLRLRDIGGIIVIDFIDMVLESNRDLVLRRLTECLGRDRTRHQVAEVTSLGLVQMTRKRVGTGLLEAFSTPCEQCKGRGVVVSSAPVENPSNGNQQSGNGTGRKSRGKNKDRNNEPQQQQQQQQQQDPEEAQRAAQRIAATALLHAKAAEAAEKETKPEGEHAAQPQDQAAESEPAGKGAEKPAAAKAGSKGGSKSKSKGEAKRAAAKPGGEGESKSQGAELAAPGAVEAEPATAPVTTGTGQASTGTGPVATTPESEPTAAAGETSAAHADAAATAEDEGSAREPHVPAKRAAGPPTASTDPDRNGHAPTESGSASVLPGAQSARRPRRVASRPSGAPGPERTPAE